LAQNCHQSKI
jgi:phenylalanyl-tRNA synthetase, alpha subunit (EC 6.1.1.20)